MTANSVGRWKMPVKGGKEDSKAEGLFSEGTGSEAPAAGRNLFSLGSQPQVGHGRSQPRRPADLAEGTFISRCRPAYAPKILCVRSLLRRRLLTRSCA